MSSRLRTWTGRALSPSMRLIDEPVTSTRSSRDGGALVPCASAATGRRTITTPQAATRRLREFDMRGPAIIVNTLGEWQLQT